MNTGETVQLTIDGRRYTVEVLRRVVQPVQAPRLVIVSWLPNEMAQDILRVCIQTIQRRTPEPHELWVVDNNSPRKNLEWLLEWPEVNLVLSRTQPLSPGKRNLFSRLVAKLRGKLGGSYANAMGLEIAARLIDPRSHYMMTLHMDTMPCRVGWLSYLQSKLNDKVRAAGMVMERFRHPDGVLHILGCLFDFQLLQELGLDFGLDPPRSDVGDRVTLTLRDGGYDVFACPSTREEPKLVERIPPRSPLWGKAIGCSFDGDGRLLFLHLGRGIRKSMGRYTKSGRVWPEEWIKLAETKFTF